MTLADGLIVGLIVAVISWIDTRLIFFVIAASALYLML